MIAHYRADFQTTFSMKSIQEHLLQLLQMVPASKMLQVPLYIDALFEHFSNAQLNQVHNISQNVTLHSMDCLFKYNENCARFTHVLS